VLAVGVGGGLLVPLEAEVDEIVPVAGAGPPQLAAANPMRLFALSKRTY